MNNGDLVATFGVKGCNSFEIDSNGFYMVFLDNSGKLPSRSEGSHARLIVGWSAGKISMQERWLSVDEIAAHLGVNPDTIYKWITRKKMPAHKLGRLWKFLASEVDQWVKGGHAAEDVVPPGPGSDPKRKLPRH
jgi:excisionase family DNA binding protein